MQKTTELENLLSPAIEALASGVHLWGIEFVPGERNSLLRLYVDAHDRPVTIDDCEAVSREVSALLDVNDPIAGNYNLEVSSPGLDRLLFQPAHYQRFVGNKVKISLAVPLNGRKRLQGTLLAAGGEEFRLAEGDVEMSVAYSQVHKTRIVPDFSSPNDKQPDAGRGRSKRREKSSR